MKWWHSPWSHFLSFLCDCVPQPFCSKVTRHCKIEMQILPCQNMRHCYFICSPHPWDGKVFTSSLGYHSPSSEKVGVFFFFLAQIWIIGKLKEAVASLHRLLQIRSIRLVVCIILIICSFNLSLCACYAYTLLQQILVLHREILLIERVGGGEHYSLTQCSSGHDKSCRTWEFFTDMFLWFHVTWMQKHEEFD